MLPDVLKRMSQNLGWTTELGNAFLAQQEGVMQAIQRMRLRAQQNGQLKSTPQQTVTTETSNGQSYIVIEPASPEVVYVPQYNPEAVWGRLLTPIHRCIIRPGSASSLLERDLPSGQSGVEAGAIGGGTRDGKCESFRAG
jgi:hypothetical protein